MIRTVAATATVSAAGLFATALLVPSAGAAERAPAYSAGATRCTAEAVVHLLPGLALQEAPSSYRIDPGPATCDGPVGGAMPTGPGTYSGAGRFDGPVSCVGGGGGWGVVLLKIPTSKGMKTIMNPLTFTFGAVTKDGLSTGRYEGDYLSATFTATPVKGDCVSSAVTKAKLAVDFTVHPFKAPS